LGNLLPVAHGRLGSGDNNTGRTVVSRDDISLIVQAMKNESVKPERAIMRDRLVELALIFERIVNEEWEEAEQT